MSAVEIGSSENGDCGQNHDFVEDLLSGRNHVESWNFYWTMYLMRSFHSQYFNSLTRFLHEICICTKYWKRTIFPCKVHIMQNSSKFYFRFIYIPFDRAWKVGYKCVIFKSIGLRLSKKKTKKLWDGEKTVKTSSKCFFPETFKFFVSYVSIIFLKDYFLVLHWKLSLKMLFDWVWSGNAVHMSLSKKTTQTHFCSIHRQFCKAF